MSLKSQQPQQSLFLEIPAEVIAKIPAHLALFYKIIPVNFENDTLTIATANPNDIYTKDAIGLATQHKIKTVWSDEKDILEAIRKHYGIGAETIEGMMLQRDPSQQSGNTPETIENIEEITDEASVGKWVNQILLAAYKDRATDIHIETFENDLAVRYRVDGLLYEANVPANIKHFKEAVISRIKVLSRLNIAEKRLPQDGRFKVKAGSVDLDLRVSFLPTLYGENAVIRILNSTRLYHLEELGLSPSYWNLLSGLIQKPHGIIFVTGPTGSGKTTTLYSCLSQVHTTEKKILTIEDPIEYQLAGITQIQINPAIGLTFAAGLRSMLRHDPDIMMVGEVRDLETAEIAIQVALTGHLVFSTLHTNDAASAITRLLDMGVEPYLISSAVECFIAQRLIRRICVHCKKEVPATKQLMNGFAENLESDFVPLWEGQGCVHCKGTGYYGREAIYEFLIMDEELRQKIMDRAPASQIRKSAMRKGMRTLRQDGWEKVKCGLTTTSEVLRVTHEQGFLLVESLVAMAVLCVCLAAFFQVLTMDLWAMRQTQDFKTASQLAENKMGDLVQKGVIEDSISEEGRFQKPFEQYQYKLESSPMNIVTTESQMNRVKLTLHWLSNKRPQELSLATFLFRKRN